jgi:hypothetical protein
MISGTNRPFNMPKDSFAGPTLGNRKLPISSDHRLLSTGQTETTISGQVPGDAPVAGLIGRFFHYGWRAVRGNLVQDEGRVSLVVYRQPARIRALLEVR